MSVIPKDGVYAIQCNTNEKSIKASFERFKTRKNQGNKQKILVLWQIGDRLLIHRLKKTTHIKNPKQSLETIARYKG